MNMFCNSDLKQININMLDFGKTEWESRKIDHDWLNTHSFVQGAKNWMEDDLNISPEIILTKNARDLPHGRSIVISWQSGKTTKILFDQGMGYWKPYGNTHDLGFNFEQSVEEQFTKMLQAFDSLSIQHGSSWPTYLVISHNLNPQT